MGDSSYQQIQVDSSDDEPNKCQLEMESIPAANGDTEATSPPAEYPDQRIGRIAEFCQKHSQAIRISKIIMVLIITYSFTIAAYIINPDHSSILFGVVIFATVCMLLYAIYKVVEWCNPPDLLDLVQKRFPRINMVAGIIAGLILLGFMIAFMINRPVRKIQAFGGLVVYVLLCFLFSKERRKIKWRSIFWGLGLQFVFAMFILKTKIGEDLFDFIGEQTSVFLDYSKIGSRFVLGKVAVEGAGEGVADPLDYQIWAFAILPTVVFFSSFVSILFHIGALQVLIMGISKIMFLTMQTSVVESLNAAGNIFVGMTEAPLMIRPFLPKMTKSEIHAVMTGGFATIAGGVLAAYISMGVPAKHLIAASVMSCPAALAISKLVYPEREKSEFTSGDDFVIPPLEDAKNFIEAAKNGASVSIGLCANIAVMLITFMSFYACFESWFGYLAECIHLGLTFRELLGYIFVPFAWLLGVEEVDCRNAGELLANKMLVNEYVAYTKLAAMVMEEQINERTKVIMTYALCGFGNISSMGIQVGALSVMAPNRKSHFSKLVVSSMLAGTIACQMTACIAGILLDLEPGS